MEAQTEETAEPAPEPKRTEPTKWNWTVASISAAFVLGVLYAAELISTGYHYAKLQDGFVRSLTPDADLNFVVDNPEYSRLFIVENRLIKDLRPLISLVSQEDASKASAYLKRQSFAKTALNDRLVNSLTRLADVHQLLETQKDEHDKLLARMEAYQGQFLEIQTEFRAFLDAEQSPKLVRLEKGETVDIGFYKGGVLVDLPVMTGTPDEIPDFKALLQYHKLVKTGTPAPSADTLHNKLNEIRGRSLALKVEYTSVADQFESVKESLKKLQTLRSEHFQETKEAIRKLLVSLGKPDTDTQTVGAYYLFRETVSQWGWDLPELNA